MTDAAIHSPDRVPPPLVVAITARALFHMEDSHALFEREGIAAFADHQRRNEDVVLEPGIAFPLVRKLLALNAGAAADAPRVEVILLSRNSSDTGLRVFNSIQHHGLDIRRATFTSGAPVWPYIKPFGAQLFLSANPDSVRGALEAGIAAATILPAKAEFAQDVFERADRVVVDDMENARRGSRELRERFGAEGAPWQDVAVLSDLLAAGESRPQDARLTIFKGMGMGLSDLAMARVVYEHARDHGLGVALPPQTRENLLLAQP